MVKICEVINLGKTLLNKCWSQLGTTKMVPSEFVLTSQNHFAHALAISAIIWILQNGTEMKICVQRFIKEVLLENKAGKETNQVSVFQPSSAEGSFLLSHRLVCEL